MVLLPWVFLTKSIDENQNLFNIVFFQEQWSSGSPINVQYFSHEHEQPDWTPSWKIYTEFLNWYYRVHKTHKINRDILVYLNTILVATKKPRDVMLEKISRLDKQIRFKKENKERFSCVLLLVWNINFKTWINIPCNESLLDKAAVVCFNQTKLDGRVLVNFTGIKGTFQNNSQIWNTIFCNDSSSVSWEKLCNGRRDCPVNEDEDWCQHIVLNFTLNNLVRSHWVRLEANKYQVQLPDFNQISNTLNWTKFLHSENCRTCLFNVSQRMNGTQIEHCVQGKHLDKCEDDPCSGTFKCLGYYCLPWRYVCDDIWHCPSGFDEHKDLCENPHKPGFYHCSNSSIYITQSSVCDGVLDCPDAKDEAQCDLHGLVCPPPCVCVLYTLICYGWDASFSVKRPYPHKLLYLSGLFTSMQIFTVMVNLHLIQFAQFKHNTFEDFCLNFPTKFPSIGFLLATENKIETLNSFCFLSVPKVTHVTLSRNNMKTKHCHTFADDAVVLSLDLSQNNLQNIKVCHFSNMRQLNTLNLSFNQISQLQSTSFLSLKELESLDLWMNNISDVDLDFRTLLARIKRVRTSSFAICCLSGKQKCYTLRQNHASCEATFLGSNIFQYTIWVVTAIVLLVNVIAVFKRARNKQDKNQMEVKKTLAKGFSYLVNGSCLGHFVVCFLLFFTAFVDAFYGADFKKESYHLRTRLCHYLVLLFIITSVESPLSATLVTVTRFMLVFYPLDTKFKEHQFVRTLFLDCFFFVLTYSVILTFLAALFGKHDEELSLNLCLPFRNSGYPFGVAAAIIVPISSLGICTSLSLFILYWKIRQQVKHQDIYGSMVSIRETRHHSSDKKRSTTSLSVKASLFCFSDLISSFTPCVLFMIMLFNKKYPHLLPVSTLSVLIPVKRIVHPILLQL